MNNKQEESAAINEANRMTASASRVLTLARHAFAEARDNLTQLEAAYEKSWQTAYIAARYGKEEA